MSLRKSYSLQTLLLLVLLACSNVSLWLRWSPWYLKFKSEGHAGSVYALAFSPDGQSFASAGEDGSLRIWSSASGKNLLSINADKFYLHSIAFSANGDVIFAAGGDKTFHSWNSNTGQMLATFTGHDATVNSISVSNDSSRIATSSNDTTVRFWDAHTGQGLLVLTGFKEEVRHTSISLDNRYVLAASANEGFARVWDAETGKQLALLGNGEVTNAQFSPNGKKIITASEGQGTYACTVRVWDALNFQELAVLKGGSSGHKDVQFSSDSKRIAISRFDGTIEVWSSESYNELVRLHGHVGDVNVALFSPEGNRIVSAGADGTIRIWNSYTGAEIAVLNGHTSQETNEIQLSPNGELIVSCEYRGKEVLGWARRRIETKYSWLTMPEPWLDLISLILLIRRFVQIFLSRKGTH